MGIGSTRLWDVARFIDCFCLGINDWFWKLEDGDAKVYALGPYSTQSPQYAEAQQYSTHARDTAKHLGGDATFWGRLLAGSVYLSGLGNEIDYIAPYPGHSTTSAQPVISEALTILAGSLRKKYLPDLIVRHTTAPKSQTARTQGRAVDPLDQLNTIRLNPKPTKCLAWLKTIKRDYHAFLQRPKLRPYEINKLSAAPQRTRHWFSQRISNQEAMADLGKVFVRYYNWKWPK
jgi:hypothetical protein